MLGLTATIGHKKQSMTFGSKMALIQRVVGRPRFLLINLVIIKCITLLSYNKFYSIFIAFYQKRRVSSWLPNVTLTFAQGPLLLYLL